MAEQTPWLVVGDLPCLECGYCLRGLVGPVIMCPECGEPNNLRNSLPWELRLLMKMDDRRGASVQAAAMTSVGVLLLAAFVWAMIVLDWLSPMWIAFFILALLAVAARWVNQIRRWRREAESLRHAIVIGAAQHLATYITLPLVGSVVAGLSIGLGGGAAGPLSPLLILAVTIFVSDAILRRIALGQVGSGYDPSWRRLQGYVNIPDATPPPPTADGGPLIDGRQGVAKEGGDGT